MPYSDEFKQAAVRRVSSGEPMSAVARELGVSATSLRRWADTIEVDLPPSAPARLIEATERAIGAMATSEEHAAHVQSLRMLAIRLDDVFDAGEFDDKAWREYRLALASLREATSGGGSDPYDDFLENVRAEMGDTKNAVT